MITLSPNAHADLQPLPVQAAWSPTGADEIKTVAICAGSGSGVLKGVDADLYLTGEMGHVSLKGFALNGAAESPDTPVVSFALVHRPH